MIAQFATLVAIRSKNQNSANFVRKPIAQIAKLKQDLFPSTTLKNFVGVTSVFNVTKSSYIVTL
mgnify:CR=1 FL=1